MLFSFSSLFRFVLFGSCELDSAHILQWCFFRFSCKWIFCGYNFSSLSLKCVTSLRENDSKLQEFIFVLVVFVIRFKIQAVRQAFVTVAYVVLQWFLATGHEFNWKIAIANLKFAQDRQRERKRQRLEHNNNNTKIIAAAVTAEYN